MRQNELVKIKKKMSFKSSQNDEDEENENEASANGGTEAESGGENGENDEDEADEDEDEAENGEQVGEDGLVVGGGGGEENEERKNNSVSSSSSSHCRLRRRDTPHHLKGARIQSPGTNKAQQLDANEMRELLDKYKPVPATRTTVQSLSSGTNEPDVCSADASQQHQSQLISAAHMAAEELTRNDPIRKLVQLVVGLTVATSGSLGIRIAGGKGSANPYRDDDDGVFITRILDDSPARHTGLKVGDKLLKVNNHSLNEMTHQQAADALKDAVKAGAGAQLTLCVLQEVDFNKVGLITSCFYRLYSPNSVCLCVRKFPFLPKQTSLNISKNRRYIKVPKIGNIKQKNFNSLVSFDRKYVI